MVSPANEEVPVDVLSVPLNARVSEVTTKTPARSNVPELPTVVPASAVPRAVLLLTFNVPALTVVAPIYVLLEVTVNTPPPALVRLLAPEITPAIVLAPPSPVVSPAVKTTLPAVQLVMTE